jgi:hypothetical protein
MHAEIQPKAGNGKSGARCVCYLYLCPPIEVTKKDGALKSRAIISRENTPLASSKDFFALKAPSTASIKDTYGLTLILRAMGVTRVLEQGNTRPLGDFK